MPVPAICLLLGSPGTPGLEGPQAIPGSRKVEQVGLGPRFDERLEPGPILTPTAVLSFPPPGLEKLVALVTGR